MQQILVTGASGFLGSNIVRQLCDLGYAVKIMVRPGADLQAIADLPYTIFHGHIDNASDVMKAVEGCDRVIHAASITQPWGISLAEYENININGTRNIAAACLAHGIKKLVHVSTANTFASGTKLQPGNELGGFTLFHVNSGYINTKYIAQQYILEQVQAAQLPAVIVNPTFMIGPQDSKPSSGRIILYGAGKRLLFYPPGGKNFVPVDDVCNCIINALSIGRPGECYLAAGENLSYREFFELLKKITGQKQYLLKIPALALKLAGLAGSLVGMISGKTQKLNYASATLLCTDNYYTSSKAERELHVSPTPLSIAVQRAWEWFTQKKYC